MGDPENCFPVGGSVHGRGGFGAATGGAWRCPHELQRNGEEPTAGVNGREASRDKAPDGQQRMRCVKAIGMTPFLWHWKANFLKYGPTYSVVAAITKYYRRGGLNNRNSFSQSSGGWKPKMKVWGGLVSPEASLSGSQIATFLLCPPVIFSLYAGTPGVSSLSDKDTNHIGSGPHS